MGSHAARSPRICGQDRLGRLLLLLLLLDAFVGFCLGHHAALIHPVQLVAPPALEQVKFSRNFVHKMRAKSIINASAACS